MAVSLSIFPLTPRHSFKYFFLYLSPNPVSFFLTHYRPCLSFNLVLSPTLSFCLSHSYLFLSLPSCLSFPHTLYLSICSSLSLSLSLSLSPLSPTVHTVCHSFFSLSLLPLSFFLFFPLWLSLSPNVTVFLSFSLSLPACLSFYHSLSYHVTLSIFFSICGSLSLSPTPDPVSLSIFNSLTHPVSLCIFLSLPPYFYFFSIGYVKMLCAGITARCARTKF